MHGEELKEEIARLLQKIALEVRVYREQDWEAICEGTALPLANDPILQLKTDFEPDDGKLRRPTLVNPATGELVQAANAGLEFCVVELSSLATHGLFGAKRNLVVSEAKCMLHGR